LGRVKRKNCHQSGSPATGRPPSSSDLNGGGEGEAQGLSEARSSRPAGRPASPSRPRANGIAGLPRASWNREWLFGLVLIAATVLAYLPALHGDFVWDDDTHISDNKTLHSLGGLWEIWFKPGATCQYYPLTFTGFWIGYHLWGLNTPGYHLMNVLLHGLAAVLLWQVLARLKVRGAALAGAIFALHPVCVMSVAWMTELKNTLSGALALAAGWAYVRFARLGVYATEQGSGAANGKVLGSDWRYCILALALFQLALFAKTAVSFLPVTLLLVAWWQRERLCWREAWPLLAMLGMAVAMGEVTIYVERHSGGASGEQFHIPFLERVLISGRSFWFYLGKLFYPHRLTFMYERWKTDTGAMWQYAYPAATVGLLAGLWGLRRRIGKGPFAALLHFYVSASLLILIVAPYFTLYSFVSDHWQYFGCMSVIALGAALVVRAAERLGSAALLYGFAVVVLPVLGVLTWQQSKMYSDIETLWGATLARNPNCWMAQNNLGNALLQKGQLDEAIAHYQKAFEIQPGYAEARNNLGNALLQKGQLDAAIAQFQSVLETQPGFAMAHYNLGTALLLKGQMDEAIVQFKKTLEIQPDYANARINLGSALLQKGQLDAAIAQFQKALEVQPDFPEAHNNLGNALLQKGQVDEAIAQFQKTLEIRPDAAPAHNDLGYALLQKGRVNEAIAHFQKALEIQPDFALAHDGLVRAAWVLVTSPQASVRNGARAVELAQQAERLSGGRNPDILGTLAAAYAEAGRFPEAVTTAQRAARLANAQNDTALADALQGQLRLYQTGSPLRDTYQTNAAPGSSRP
jgi:protein O-mannosyl-transferase